MKCLLIHADNFHCDSFPNAKSRKYGIKLSNQVTDQTNCLVVFICFEPNDIFLNLNQFYADLDKAVRMLGLNSIVLFPFSHLTSKLLNFKDSEGIYKVISNKILNEGKYLTKVVPFGLDKKFLIASKGHSHNVMHREYNGNMYDVYDDAIQLHTEHLEMVKVVNSKLEGNVLEVGAGTGLASKTLVENSLINLTCIEPDKNFVSRFRRKNLNVIFFQAKGERFLNPYSYDFIVMFLVFHHIPDENKIAFLTNLRKNLRQGGKIFIGDVFIPEYNTEEEKKMSLNLFHSHRLAQMDSEHFYAINIEKIALKEGLNSSGEYKVSKKFTNDCLLKAGYVDVQVMEVGDQIQGGYCIFSAKV
jgi:SAM-dependent methyltransferase